MEKHVSSSELLRRCLEGRRDADWRLFQERHGAMLRRIVAGMLLRRLPRSAGELEDAMQDLHFRLLRFGGSYAGSTDRELWAFLCRTAASVVVDLWRRWRRRRAFELPSPGLLRSAEALADLRGRTRIRRGGHGWCALPESWLDRGPEAHLLAHEEAVARYLALPKRRRRTLWRENAAEGVAPDG